MIDAPDPYLGSCLRGRFDVLELIGGGSTGRVYRARQRDLGRDVAVKIMPPSCAFEPSIRSRFLREAQTVARLKSVHTVTLFDYGELEDGGLFMVMEMIEGGSLERLLDARRRVDFEDARRWLLDITASLAEAHAAGIVHRDVKPANIMIGSTHPERAQLVDFGIAKVLHEATQLTETGEVFGTPAYMAPEIWSSEYGAVGPATDIYALGAVLLVMLTGELPFRKRSLPQMMHAHLHDAPDTIALHRTGVPDALGVERLIRRCLAKRPSDRFASVAELAESLERIGVEADPFEPAARKPRRRAAVLLASAATVAAVGFAVSSIGTNGASPSPVAEPNRSPSTPAVGLVATSTKSETPREEKIDRRRRRLRVIRDAVVGDVDPEAMEAVELEMNRALRACAERVRVSKTRTVRVVIGAGGHVTSVASHPVSPSLTRCIERRVASTTFASPDGHFIVVSWRMSRAHE